MGIKKFRKPGLISAPVLAECFPHPGQCGIQPDDFPGFGIPDFQDAHVRKLFFPGICDLNDDNVVPAVGCLQRLLKALVEKVGDKKYDRSFAYDQIQVFQRLLDAGAAMFRLIEEHLANHAQHMRTAAPWRDELFHAIREQDGADTIVIFDG